MTSHMTKSYAIVALVNGNISSVPIIWFLQDNNKKIIIKDQNYELYLPPHNFAKESEGYANVQKHWIKSNGMVLNITDSYLKGNYLSILENIKSSKYCIAEFLKDESAEVVPCNWIVTDNVVQQFKCKWPGSKLALKYAQSQKGPLTSWTTYECVPRKFFHSYKDAKLKLSRFCITSSTEIDDDPMIFSMHTELKKRKDKFEPSENTFYKKKSKKNNFSNLHMYSGDKSNESDDQSESMFSNELIMQNVPDTNKFDIYNSADNTTDYLLKSPLKTSEYCNPIEPSNVTESINENISTQKFIVSDVMHSLQHIGHIIMKVSGQLSTVQKDMGIMKVDIIKNQELLTDLIDKLRRQSTHVTEESYDRSKLKLPIMTMDHLKALEDNDEQKQILAHVLRRNGKTFDLKRTTYQIMKTFMDNRLAECINMEGRRGDKLAFARLEVCKIITESVKDMFPDESMQNIKNHMSDWLKQAPKRK